MRIYEKGDFVIVDLEGEINITTILNEARNVVVKGWQVAAAQEAVRKHSPNCAIWRSVLVDCDCGLMRSRGD